MSSSESCLLEGDTKRRRYEKVRTCRQTITHHVCIRSSITTTTWLVRGGQIPITVAAEKQREIQQNYRCKRSPLCRFVPSKFHHWSPQVEILCYQV